MPVSEGGYQVSKERFLNTAGVLRPPEDADGLGLGGSVI